MDTYQWVIKENKRQKVILKDWDQFQLMDD